MTDKTKYCKDCKWSSDEGSTPSHPRALWACSNDRVGSKIDVVDGKRLLMDCHKARSDSGVCQPHGRFWEER